MSTSMLERTRSFKQKELKSWTSKKGDAIAGPVTESLTLVTFKNGDERYMLKIRSEADGEEYAIWGGTILFDEFKKLNPQPTDVLGIVCWGEPEGKRWKDYTVEIDRHVSYRPFEGLDPSSNGQDSSLADDDIPKYPPPPKSEPPK